MKPGSLGITIIDIDLHDPKNGPPIAAAERQARLPAMVAVVIEALGPPLGQWSTREGCHLAYPRVPGHTKTFWLYGEAITSDTGKGHQVVIHDAPALFAAVDALAPNLVPPDLSFLPAEEETPLPEADTSEETPAPDTDTPRAKKKTKATPKPRQTPEALGSMTEGKRNNYLNNGVFLDARDGELTSERTDAWRAAAHASGLSPSEIDTTIRSATEAGQKAESEFIRHPINNRIVVKNQRNIHRALRRLNAELWYDEFTCKPMISYGTFHQCAYEDEQRGRLLSDIESTCKFIPPDGYFDRVVSDVQWRHKVHPVREYLEALVWDRQPRIDDWLMAYAGVTPGNNDSEEAYIKAVSRIFLIAAVGRIYQPGVKFDEMVVLESEQGTGKSSLLHALCHNEDWFSDDLPLNVDAKQIIERTAGKWLIEAAELSGMHASKVEHLKTMLSRGSDGPVRLAYGRLPVEKPRHFVLMGTTNAAAYLDDPTGNRRFWPVTVNTILLPEIRRDRDQLWAEAVVRWKDPEHGGPASIRLHETLYEVAGTEQEKRRTVDPWESTLEAAFPDDDYRLMPQEVWKELGISTDRQDQRMAKRVSAIMQRLGFQRMSVRDPEDWKTSRT